MRSVRLKPEQEPFRAALEEALVGELYLRVRESLVALAFVLPILWLVIGLHARAQSSVRGVFGWLYAIILLRAVTIWLARRKRGVFASVNVRHRVFAAGAIAISAGLATLLVIVIPFLDAAHLSLLALAYTGIAAIALVSMGSSPAIYFGYMLVMLTPLLALTLLGKVASAPEYFVPMLLLYVAALSAMAMHEFRTRRDNILLRLQVAEMALIDPLTQLRNRRFVQETMPTEAAAVMRSWRKAPHGPPPSKSGVVRGLRSALWIIIVDLDHFKRINDGYGHDAGDSVLRKAAAILRDSLRKQDVIARWGGEEFVIIARDLDPDLGGAALAERVRQKFADSTFPLPSGAKVGLTCSLGYAPFPFLPEAPEALGWEDVLALADAGLYRAKRDGRNRSVGVSAGDRDWSSPKIALEAARKDATEASDVGWVKLSSSASTSEVVRRSDAPAATKEA